MGSLRLADGQPRIGDGVDPVDVDPESGVELPEVPIDEVPGDADEGLSPVNERLDDNDPGSSDDITPGTRSGGDAPERLTG